VRLSPKQRRLQVALSSFRAVVSFLLALSQHAVASYRLVRSKIKPSDKSCELT
jgi:hypothetical protein